MEADEVTPSERAEASGHARLNVGWRQGSGTPLVLLHDVGGSWEDWEVVAEILSESYEVFAVDLLGFGASPKPADLAYTLDDHVAALELTLAPLLQGSRARIVGYSLGALVALGYAAAHPSSVVDLVLVAPPIMLTREQAGRLGVESASEDQRAGTDSGVVSDRLRAALVQRTFRRRVPEDTGERTPAAARTIEHAIGEQDVPGLLAQTAAPVTIVYGTRDPVIVTEHVEALARADSGIELHSLNAAHELLDERPAGVVTRIAPEIGPERLGDLASRQHRLQRRIAGRRTARRVLSSGVGTIALRGLAALFTGLAIVWLGGSSGISVVVAVYLLLEGVLLAAGASSAPGTGPSRVLLGALGVAWLAAGAIALAAPAALVPALAIRTAAMGALDLYAGLDLVPGLTRRWLLAAEGALSLAAAALFLVSAGSDDALALAAGLYFLLSGLLLIGQTVASELARPRSRR